ncbi:hypothetical protein [Fusibacter bizertensis]
MAISKPYQTTNIKSIKQFVYKKNMIMILYFSVLSLLSFDVINGLYLESLGVISNLLNLRGLAVVLMLYFHSKMRRIGYLKMLRTPDENNKVLISYSTPALHGLILIIFMRFALTGGAVEPYFFILYYILSWVRDSMFFKSKSLKMPTHDFTEHVTKGYLIKRNLLLLAVLSVSSFFNLDANAYFYPIITYSSFTFILSYSLMMFLSLTLLYFIYINDIRLGIPDKIEAYFKTNKNILYGIHIVTQILCIIAIYILVTRSTFEIPLLIAISLLTAIRENLIYKYIF